MKLDSRQVRRIRERFLKGDVSLSKLAQSYNVAPSTIFNVVNNLSHYDPSYTTPVAADDLPFDFEFAQRLRESGKTLPAIAHAEQLKHARVRPFSTSTISNRLRGA